MTALAHDKQAERIRAELVLLRSRYDSGAVSPAIYSVIRRLESDLAWAEHRQQSIKQ